MTEALAVRSASFLERARSVADTVARALPVLDLLTPEHEQRAGQYLRAIATLRKAGDALRKEEKRPHLDAGRAVDARYNEPDAVLADAESQLRRKISEAKARREAERLAEIALAAEAARAGDAEAANAAIVRAAQAAPEAIAGVGERWTYEPVSIDLAKVPREFLAIDMSRVRAEISAAIREDREPSIPGIAFARKVDLRVRGLG